MGYLNTTTRSTRHGTDSIAVQESEETEDEAAGKMEVGSVMLCRPIRHAWMRGLDAFPRIKELAKGKLDQSSQWCERLLSYYGLIGLGQ